MCIDFLYLFYYFLFGKLPQKDKDFRYLVIDYFKNMTSCLKEIKKLY